MVGGGRRAGGAVVVGQVALVTWAPQLVVCTRQSRRIPTTNAAFTFVSTCELSIPPPVGLPKCDNSLSWQWWVYEQPNANTTRRLGSAGGVRQYPRECRKLLSRFGTSTAVPDVNGCTESRLSAGHRGDPACAPPTAQPRRRVCVGRNLHYSPLHELWDTMYALPPLPHTTWKAPPADLVRDGRPPASGRRPSRRCPPVSSLKSPFAHRCGTCLSRPGDGLCRTCRDTRWQDVRSRKEFAARRLRSKS